MTSEGTSLMRIENTKTPWLSFYTDLLPDDDPFHYLRL